MSVEFESAARLNALKQGIETKTGETYTDLTAGVQALMDEFGQGGGSGALAQGEFTVASATIALDIAHGLGVTPTVFGIYADCPWLSSINGYTAYCLIKIKHGDVVTGYGSGTRAAGNTVGYHVDASTANDQYIQFYNGGKGTYPCLVPGHVNADGVYEPITYKWFAIA